MRGGYTSRWLFKPLLILWVISTATCAPISYADSSSPLALSPLADGLLVKFKPQVTQQQAQKIAKSYGAREILSLSPKQATNSPMTQWQHLKFEPHVNLQEIMQRMVQDASVETVELNEAVTTQQ